MFKIVQAFGTRVSRSNRCWTSFLDLAALLSGAIFGPTAVKRNDLKDDSG